MYKVYYYPKCSSCNQALSFLAKHNIEFQKIDISISPPTLLELRAMLNYQKGDIKKLLNVSGQRYRELKLKDKLKDLDQAELLSLLTQEGMLIKRPFLLGEGIGLVGFKPDQWQELINNI